MLIAQQVDDTKNNADITPLFSKGKEVAGTRPIQYQTCYCRGLWKSSQLKCALSWGIKRIRKQLVIKPKTTIIFFPSLNDLNEKIDISHKYFMEDKNIQDSRYKRFICRTSSTSTRASRTCGRWN